MAKEDVLDTVDIFFGAGKSAPEKEVQEESNEGRTRGRGRRAAAERGGSEGEAAAQTPAATKGTPGMRGGYPYGGRGAAQSTGTEAESDLPDRERISFVLPTEQVEFLKNYKYCRALMDGDPQYTLTEALIEAIELLRKHSEYEVFERPDFVRAREKKPRKR